MAELVASGRRCERRITVAVVNDYELVVVGVASMLHAFRDRIEVVELDVGENPHREVDVALFDTYGHGHLGVDRVALLVGDPNVAAVAVYTGQSTSEQRDAVLAAGARGLLAKSSHADALAQALLDIAAGRQVVRPRSSVTPTNGAGRVTSSVSLHAKARSPRSWRKA